MILLTGGRKLAFQLHPLNQKSGDESQNPHLRGKRKIQQSTYVELFVPGDSIYKGSIFADIEIHIPGATV